MKFCSLLQLNCINGRGETDTNRVTCLIGVIGETGGLSGSEIDLRDEVTAEKGALHGHQKPEITKVIGMWKMKAKWVVNVRHRGLAQH